MVPARALNPWAAIALAALLSACDRGAPPQPSAADMQAARAAAQAFAAGQQRWRERRRAELIAPDGWTSLVGLHWIERGAHFVGSGGGNGIRLAMGPHELGLLDRGKDDAMRFVPARGVPLTLDGRSLTAPVLLRPMPAGDHVVQTRVRLNVPPPAPGNCCHNFVQAGLVLYDHDDRYLKLVHASLWETRQTEWAKEVPRSRPEYPRYGNGVVGPPATTTQLRVVTQRRPGKDKFTAFTRSAGGHWVRGGVWRHSLGPSAEIGLVSMGDREDENWTARFAGVQTSTLRVVQPQ